MGGKLMWVNTTDKDIKVSNGRIVVKPGHHISCDRGMGGRFGYPQAGLVNGGWHLIDEMQKKYKVGQYVNYDPEAEKKRADAAKAKLVADAKAIADKKAAENKSLEEDQAAARAVRKIESDKINAAAAAKVKSLAKQKILDEAARQEEMDNLKKSADAERRLQEQSVKQVVKKKAANTDKNK